MSEHSVFQINSIRMGCANRQLQTTSSIMLSSFLINFTKSSDFVTALCIRSKLYKASGDSQVQFRPPSDPASMVQKVT